MFMIINKTRLFLGLFLLAQMLPAGSIRASVSVPCFRDVLSPRLSVGSSALRTSAGEYIARTKEGNVSTEIFLPAEESLRLREGESATVFLAKEPVWFSGENFKTELTLEEGGLRLKHFADYIEKGNFEKSDKDDFVPLKAYNEKNYNRQEVPLTSTEATKIEASYEEERFDLRVEAEPGAGRLMLRVTARNDMTIETKNLLAPISQSIIDENVKKLFSDEPVNILSGHAVLLHQVYGSIEALVDGNGRIIAFAGGKMAPKPGEADWERVAYTVSVNVKLDKPYTDDMPRFKLGGVRWNRLGGNLKEVDSPPSIARALKESMHRANSEAQKAMTRATAEMRPGEIRTFGTMTDLWVRVTGKRFVGISKNMPEPLSLGQWISAGAKFYRVSEENGQLFLERYSERDGIPDDMSKQVLDTMRPGLLRQFIIGRNSEYIKFPAGQEDVSFSRRHFILDVSVDAGGKLTLHITDPGSLNGTAVMRDRNYYYRVFVRSGNTGKSETVFQSYADPQGEPLEQEILLPREENDQKKEPSDINGWDRYSRYLIGPRVGTSIEEADPVFVAFDRTKRAYGNLMYERNRRDSLSKTVIDSANQLSKLELTEMQFELVLGEKGWSGIEGTLRFLGDGNAEVSELVDIAKDESTIFSMLVAPPIIVPNPQAVDSLIISFSI